MENKIKYHFIGIGGVSMSALALILHSCGYIVKGSDSVKNEFTEKLISQGIKVFIGNDEKNLGDCDVVVYTSAIAKNNPELMLAKQKNKIILTRAALLQEISNDFENVIAVSGAHGKTTVTGMIAECLIRAGYNPTAHIGGVLKSVGENYVIGGSKYFVTEACEYKNNFLFLKPTIGVILNVEPEHLDFFGTYDNVIKSFSLFAKNCQTVIMYQKVPLTHDNQIIYGSAGYNARKVTQLKDGKYKFDCYYDNKKLFSVMLNIVGKHNIYNALATIAVCRKVGVSNKVIATSLQEFSGIGRRFDIQKERPFIVHDYAHHPAQIKSVIEATRTFKKGNIIVAFQPHTYTRTIMLMDEFMSAFDGASELCVIKTYSAREPYMRSGSAKTLFDNLKKNTRHIGYFPTMNLCYKYLKAKLKPTDTLLILGAGDIEKLAQMFKT